MTRRTRPLSPHLTIYRNPVTSYLSMGNRMSLVLLSVSSLGWVAWLHALASGPEAYLRFMEWLAFWPVTLFLMGVAQAFFYHLCMECCHFIWDTGRGFEISSGVRLAVGAAILSLILNLVFWILIWIQ